MAELLSPAGSREALEAAAYFGADAVYAAGKTYGLRAYANNLSTEEIKDAAAMLHGADKRLYITVNAVFRDSDFTGLEGYLEELRDARVDAFIVSDPGVLCTAKRVAPDIPLHLSTQANATNAKSALFWHETGVSRIILSRELSLEEISFMRRNTPETLQFEAFVHGAMCISYSGRCLLSNFLTGRSGNRGECAQPCRWEYNISEQGFPGEYFPIQEDGRGTYILNSKDLCMISHIKDVIDAGVSSLKIEGRMKSEYYVACLTGAYRRAIDDAEAGRPFDNALLDEVLKAGSRAYTTGFFYGNPRGSGQDTSLSAPQRTYDFVAKVKEARNDGGLVRIEQRGKFLQGDELEVLSPHTSGSFTVTDIFTPEGERVTSAPHPKEVLNINCPYDLKPGDMLRKRAVPADR